MGQAAVMNHGNRWIDAPKLRCHHHVGIYSSRVIKFHVRFFNSVLHAMALSFTFNWYMASRLLKIPRVISASTHFSTTARTFNPASRSIPRLNRIQFHTSAKIMADASTYRANGDNGDDGSTDGELNQWKHRAPYKVHDNDPNFHARYHGSCHCGKVQYQLSREKPLDSKYCHCTTCQKIHGMHRHHRTDRIANVFLQVHPSSGQPSFTKRTSTSQRVTTT